MGWEENKGKREGGRRGWGTYRRLQVVRSTLCTLVNSCLLCSAGIPHLSKTFSGE